MRMDPRTSTNASPAVLRNRIEIREGNEADNEGLLALTRATPMGGTIALRIDRDPNFFALLRMRGESKVYVAVRSGEIAGCISAAFRTVYISGVPETAAYVGDMKVHPRFSGSRIALLLIQALEAYLKSAGIDLCFSVAAGGNHRVMPLFEGRLGIPRWASLGQFIVKELLPSPFDRPAGGYDIEAAAPGDLMAITQLLDRFHRSRQFAPRLMEAEIARTLGRNVEDPFCKTFVARDHRGIVATLAILDTADVKRNVLLSAPRSARAAVALLRLLALPFPGFCIPRIGDPLRLLTVRHYACEDGHLEALRLLVKRARAEAFRKRFTFLVLGVHERDPLRRLFQGMPGFTFPSLAFATSLTAPERLEELARGIPYEDYALV